MPFDNLGAFIQALDSAGELKTLTQPVSSRLEISRYTNAESKKPRGGKALLFKSVAGSKFPVATNLFGSPRRICMALGVDDLSDLSQRVKAHIDVEPPRNLRDAFSLINMLFSAGRSLPRKFSGSPPCREIVLTGDDVDLGMLPVLHCWPKDAGPFITLPVVITRSLVTGRRNMGMYRMQVFDRNTTGMHWHIHKDGSHYYNEYRRAGKRMPVAVAVGCDPAVTYAATAPMPRGIDEMILAGFIRRKPVRTAKCVTVDLEVPAEAEFVLEGYVDPGELRREGPFGDHTGYYSLADDYPVFHVTALTHRRDPVYNATLVGPPPMEDCYLAKATERFFLPLLQAVLPEIVDYWFPWEGVFHNIVIVSITKEYPGHAQKIMNGLWGQGQMSFCKAIVVVDETVDPKNPAQVLKKLLDNLDILSDITLTKGVLDVLDHSAPLPLVGNKIGLDLTQRSESEPRRPETGGTVETVGLTETLKSNVKQRISGVTMSRSISNDHEHGFSRNRVIAMNVEKNSRRNGKFYADAILQLDMLHSFNIFILFDGDVDLNDDSYILWKLFNNVDPGRDLYFSGDRLVVDACKKLPEDGHDREWPDELVL